MQKHFLADNVLKLQYSAALGAGGVKVELGDRSEMLLHPFPLGPSEAQKSPGIVYEEATNSTVQKIQILPFT